MAVAVEANFAVLAVPHSELLCSPNHPNVGAVSDEYGRLAGSAIDEAIVAFVYVKVGCDVKDVQLTFAARVNVELLEV